MTISDHQSPPRRLRTPAAAAHVGLSESTLEKLRHFGGGPRYAKLGRIVVYTTSDLDRWCDERTRTSTSDAGAGGAS